MRPCSNGWMPADDPRVSVVVDSSRFIHSIATGQWEFRMKPKHHWIEKRQTARTVAENMLSRIAPPAESAQPADVMLHELLVHKVELEMQIEELRRTHDAMEDARDRYMELYDFAPVGYITLNPEGLIGEINLTGAALLGQERGTLLNRRFSSFVADRDQATWSCLFHNMMQHTEVDRQTFVLEMVHADASAFHAYIEWQRLQKKDAPAILRLALFDMSKIKQAEAEMILAANRFEAKG